MMTSRVTTRLAGAIAALAEAAEQASTANESVAVSVGQITAELDPATVALIAGLLGDLRDGHAVAVAPYDLVVGTSQAAETLGVSRPWLVAMLDRGDLPMRKYGSKRRVLLGDLMAFRRAQDRHRRGRPICESASELVRGVRKPRAQVAQPDHASLRPTSRWRSSTPPADWSDHTGPIEGIVELPFRLYWSDGNNRFDLTKRSRLLSLYQTVLAEGSEEDVRTFLNRRVLLDRWDDLWLSPAVHEAWDGWIEEQRCAAL